MAGPKNSSDANGEEKERYLLQLNNALKSLQADISSRNVTDYPDDLKEFGEQEEWVWEKIPFHHGLFKTIGKLVGDIATEYRRFAWILDSENPLDNRGYFDKVNISTHSGLPSAVNFYNLHRLRKRAAEAAQRQPSYASCIDDIAQILTTDSVPIDEVNQKVHEKQRESWVKNYLERLKDENLLGWRRDNITKAPVVTKRMQLGAESLWTVVNCSYSVASNMFEIYIADMWQDFDAREVWEDESCVGVSPALNARLRDYAKNNDAWHIIREIDEDFEGLHPVHVTRVMVGPFDNKYRTLGYDADRLPITQELLKEDENVGILRASLQYSYAPNVVVKGRGKDAYSRQKVYRANWRDEIVVCPAKYSNTVSDSLLGTKLKVLEM